VFDIGFVELLLIGTVALLVLGPERLPRAARMAGLWMRKARASWYSVRSELERELADEDLRRSLKASREEIQRTADELREDVGAIGRELPTLEPPVGEVVDNDASTAQPSLQGEAGGSRSAGQAP